MKTKGIIIVYLYLIVLSKSEFHFIKTISRLKSKVLTPVYWLTTYFEYYPLSIYIYITKLFYDV